MQALTVFQSVPISSGPVPSQPPVDSSIIQPVFSLFPEQHAISNSPSTLSQAIDEPNFPDCLRNLISVVSKPSQPRILVSSVSVPSQPLVSSVEEPSQPPIDLPSSSQAPDYHFLSLTVSLASPWRFLWSQNRRSHSLIVLPTMLATFPFFLNLSAFSILRSASTTLAVSCLCSPTCFSPETLRGL